MTDRELLEAAAKAAGLTYEPRMVGLWIATTPGSGGIAWNPLADDGDALRLAVALRMDITHFSESVRADVDGHDDCNESSGTDPYAATRRAIVRSAACLPKADYRTQLEKLHAEMLAALELARLDAERYRFLRNSSAGCIAQICFDKNLSWRPVGETLDAAIDAAMKGKT